MNPFDEYLKNINYQGVTQVGKRFKATALKKYIGTFDTEQQAAEEVDKYYKQRAKIPRNGFNSDRGETIRSYTGVIQVGKKFRAHCLKKYIGMFYTEREAAEAVDQYYKDNGKIPRNGFNH